MQRVGILAAALLLAVGCGSDSGEADPAEFCDRLDRLTENDPFLAFGDTATPDEIQQAFGALVDRAEELLEVAPTEAQAAARDYAESATSLDALMAGAGYDGTAVDARAYRTQQLAYADASRLLLRYLDSEC